MLYQCMEEVWISTADDCPVDFKVHAQMYWGRKKYVMEREIDLEGKGPALIGWDGNG